jgi:hypothetical protein
MVPVIAAGAALFAGGSTVGAAAGAAAAGAAAVAGGIAVKKAMSSGAKEEPATQTREVSASEVPAHIRKKIQDKARKMR